MSLPSEFYVTLASDESSGYFDTANKEPNFKNKLSTPLLFKDPYVVALTEIYIPPWDIIEKVSENSIRRAKRGIFLGGEGMNITLKDFNAEIKIPINDFLPTTGTTWELEKLLPFFLEHIIFHDSKVLNEKRAIAVAKKKLKEDLQELSETKTKQKFYSITKPKFYHYFKLKVPFKPVGESDLSYYYINVPIKKYDSLLEFFQYIMKFLPRDLRTEELLDIIFKEISKTNESDSPIVVKYKNLFLEVVQERAQEKLQHQFNSSSKSSMEVDPAAKATSGNSNAQSQQEDDTQVAQTGSVVVETIEPSETTTGIDLSDQTEDDENDLQVGSKFYTNENKLRMLYVYTDIISPHMYADKMLALLRVIPNYIAADQKHGIHLKFNNPEFYPVCKDYFETIEILISNREFDIEFIQYVKNPVYIKLLFRRVSNEG